LSILIFTFIWPFTDIVLPSAVDRVDSTLDKSTPILSIMFSEHNNNTADALSRIPVRKCKREVCRECYPNSDPYFQGQTEENELIETIISTDTETSQGQSSEPNWLDFWSKQELCNYISVIMFSQVETLLSNN
jgi:hypothetical protein